MPARKSPSAVARVFSHHPERVAAAWRRMRSTRGAAREPLHLLDGLAEPFIRALGECLAGASGKPWTRTQGVLRLSTARGAAALHAEFASLRRCLLIALDVLKAPRTDRHLVEQALVEAADSAVCLMRALEDPSAQPPPVGFGGLVVEVFEPRARLRRAAGELRTPPPDASWT